MIDKQRLDSQLIVDEGLKLKPYLDTRGNLTTGVGHNLDGKPLTTTQQAVIGHDGRSLPITHDQAVWLLHCDELDAMNDLSHHFPWWAALDDVRARVLVGLTFNMGIDKLSQFVHFITDMRTMAQFPATPNIAELAAQDLQHSAWYTQTGNRGVRYVSMVLTGQDAA